MHSSFYFLKCFFLFNSVCGQVASTGQGFPARSPDLGTTGPAHWCLNPKLFIKEFSFFSNPSLQPQTLHSSLYCFSSKVLLPCWALSKTSPCSFNVTELGNLCTLKKIKNKLSIKQKTKDINHLVLSPHSTCVHMTKT